MLVANPQGAAYPTPMTHHMSRAAGLVCREETVMPKGKKQSQKTETAEDVQKLYARTYGSRLARQVGEELEISRRTYNATQKTNANARQKTNAR
jgi:hypothetical protein